jgi:hypothetical protein
MKGLMRSPFIFNVVQNYGLEGFHRPVTQPDYKR